jgi:hypothetical protein
MTNCVVELEDGAIVVIVIVAEAAVPLDKLNCEFGLKEHVAPTIGDKLQASDTGLDRLLSGVAVTEADPDCPAVIVRLGTVVPSVKSGGFTLIETVELPALKL